jgi:pimeloyl-ACP methyl ester carboxylesterase
MRTTQSADGTTIAYDRTGNGPPLVIIVGAFCDRQTTKALSTLLGDHFTVLEYDRRGRGASGDTPPYAVDREIEDLAAVLAVAGGAAAVYGHSSGAVLGLEAAARGLPVTGLVAYEPPYTTPEGGSPTDLGQRVAAHIAAERRVEAVEAFLIEAAGVPKQFLGTIENGPDFPGMLAIAHTLPYDLAICGDGRAPIDRLSRITVPTLACDGGSSPPWAADAAEAVVRAVPGAVRRTIPEQGHGVAHEVIAPVIVEFLATP